MEALVLYVHNVITTPPNDACDVIDTADTMSAVREQSAVIWHSKKPCIEMTKQFLFSWGYPLNVINKT
jgi:hypothetical protein